MVSEVAETDRRIAADVDSIQSIKDRTMTNAGVFNAGWRLGFVVSKIWHHEGAFRSDIDMEIAGMVLREANAHCRSCRFRVCEHNTDFVTATIGSKYRDMGDGW